MFNTSSFTNSYPKCCCHNIKIQFVVVTTLLLLQRRLDSYLGKALTLPDIHVKPLLGSNIIDWSSNNMIQQYYHIPSTYTKFSSNIHQSITKCNFVPSFMNLDINL